MNMEEFIRDMEDFEIAALYKYRLPTMVSEETKKSLFEEMDQRGITEENAGRILEEQKKSLSGNEGRCSRCGSTRSGKFSKNVDRPIGLGMFEQVQQEVRYCKVCGWEEDQDH